MKLIEVLYDNKLDDVIKCKNSRIKPCTDSFYRIHKPENESYKVSPVIINYT